ncbi:AAA family ATPase [Deefgea sp. CFH1-16]|uniref:AAA family ATPase n=1 Tax=Deefgea sp. CFH1-16 TaxID=2675457 RepID=UPI0015F41EFA|nr:AAA family ATPase [Deefgea sp. CFH1-16]MBM5573197.1 AAA family ATPase [Deefgea sp. CFH1-16]
MSDGTLRFICLTTLLLQLKLPTMILLDEPELGLHPFSMQLLAAMMRSASDKTQIIASTQSVTLANQFEWQDMVVVDPIDNQSRFRRLEANEVESWLEQYKLGEIWEINVFGGRPEWFVWASAQKARPNASSLVGYRGHILQPLIFRRQGLTCGQCQPR